MHKIFYSLMVMTMALSAPVLTNKTAWAADGSDVIVTDDTELIFGADSVVEDTHLDEMRGTALDPEILGVAFFDAVSLNNSASGTVSGGNIINEGAFSDSSGLSTIIQNSGNNVLIQSATILNLSID